MMNSNKIRAALVILRRVESFLNSGLKLKDLKTELRVLPIDLHDVAPVILVATGRALRARSNADFAQRVKWAIDDAVSALKVAEQMDAIHAEALEENDMFDGIICDGLTDAQRVIHNRRMGIDIYGEGFRAAVARDHAEALEINRAYPLSQKQKDTIRQRGVEMMIKAHPFLLEEDHARALEINEALSGYDREQDQNAFWLNSPEQRRAIIESAHAEAITVGGLSFKVADA